MTNKQIIKKLRSTYDIWMLDISYATYVIDQISKLKKTNLLKINNYLMDKYLFIFPSERERYETWLENKFVKYYKETIK